MSPFFFQTIYAIKIVFSLNLLYKNCIIVLNTSFNLLKPYILIYLDFYCITFEVFLELIPDKPLF